MLKQEAMKKYYIGLRFVVAGVSFEREKRTNGSITDRLCGVEARGSCCLEKISVQKEAIRIKLHIGLRRACSHHNAYYLAHHSNVSTLS